jgi:predicted ATP-grasp superfamily ATP-dependent carboligase
VRILVFEFVSGGGLGGHDVSPSLAREGSAMLTALVTDLAAVGGHQIVTTVDPRFPIGVPDDVEVVTVSPTARARDAVLDGLMSSADAMWIVAPETNGCLERLAARAERKGVKLLGSGSSAIRRASDKARLPRLLGRLGVLHPATRVIDASREEWQVAASVAVRELGYPLVVKPVRGAGCEGVSLVRNGRELRRAVTIAREAGAAGRLVLQRYVRGVAASVSLLADGRRAIALTTNAQHIRGTRPFAYRGGATPLDHPLAARAAEEAVRVCEAMPGLRGYVGVDMVVTRREAFVIEVNPRLTTAYLGVRAALGRNVAAMALAACAGTLPELSPPCRSIRFSAGGRILQSTPRPEFRSDARSGPRSGPRSSQ